ncbi:MAG: hypothetical protein ACHQF0_17750 [Chitinophagales bacterium]
MNCLFVSIFCNCLSMIMSAITFPVSLSLFLRFALKTFSDTSTL